MSSASYLLDGRRLRTVRVADWDSRYGVELDPRELERGRHTLKARVVFVKKSGLETRTLKLPVDPCSSS